MDLLILEIQVSNGDHRQPFRFAQKAKPHKFLCLGETMVLVFGFGKI